MKILSEMVDKDGLTQCIKLLATYIALYKKDFGELSIESYESVFNSTNIETGMVSIFEDGLNEAVAMLFMIINIQKQQGTNEMAVTINY